MKNRVLTNCRGQTLIEFIFSSALVMLAIGGSGWLFKAEWQRAKCAYIVFEKTHAKIVGSADPEPQELVFFSESEDGLSGESTCGQARERVSLPKLERASWP
jgi:hypothetical protein